MTVELNSTTAAKYNETDASNTAASPNGWPSGTYPNQVEANNRTTLGALQRFWNRANGALVVGGTANAITLTPVNTSYPTSYVTGELYQFTAAAPNTSATTININSLGAQNLYKKGSSGVVACVGGEIQTGDQVLISYDGTQFQIISQTASGSGSVNSGTTGQIAYYASSGNTISGSSALPSGTTATTQTASNNSTRVATTAYVDRGSSGASMVLLATATASNSASIAFTSIPSGYDQYDIRFTQVVPITNAADLVYVVSSDNGSSYLSANYVWTGFETSQGGGSGAHGSASDGSFHLSYSIASVGPGSSGNFSMHNLSSSAQLSWVSHTLSYNTSGDTIQNTSGGRQGGTNGPFNAIKILFTSGNISEGKFALYGIRNS